jgi:hypothetical protein
MECLNARDVPRLFPSTADANGRSSPFADLGHVCVSIDVPDGTFGYLLSISPSGLQDIQS